MFPRELNKLWTCRVFSAPGSKILHDSPMTGQVYQGNSPLSGVNICLSLLAVTVTNIMAKASAGAKDFFHLYN